MSRLRQVVITGNLCRIPLGKSKRFSYCDAADYTVVSRHNWYELRKPGKTVYARTKIKKGKEYKTVLLHRFITKLEDPKIQIDHHNGDGLDNRRENIRACNGQQNSQNKKVPKSNIIGYKGVSIRRYKTKIWYQARIRNKREISLGSFNNPKAAAEAYDKAAIKYFGKFSKVNFPKQKVQA